MKRLSIRIPRWIHEWLQKEAKKRGLSVNGLITQMCYEFASKD
ncbi:toxin-antitoxin system HicB family antitoxin [Aerococcaceae bacterium zg-ZJ1578]|nr:toxin-antitoxin system HicB family antitoxin [Aerococcaceae bacterium zg-1578]MBR7928415.1 toxin-antitoxin system HicB family antitoxin [Aerococcaceae bacterium zg-ZUI334]